MEFLSASFALVGVFLVLFDCFRTFASSRLRYAALYALLAAFAAVHAFTGYIWFQKNAGVLAPATDAASEEEEDAMTASEQAPAVPGSNEHPAIAVERTTHEGSPAGSEASGKFSDIIGVSDQPSATRTATEQSPTTGVASSDNTTGISGHSSQSSAIEEAINQSPTTEATVEQLSASSTTDDEGSATTAESRTQLSAAEVVDDHSLATEITEEQSSASGGASSPEPANSGGDEYQPSNPGSSADSNLSNSEHWLLVSNEVALEVRIDEASGVQGW